MSKLTLVWHNTLAKKWLPVGELKHEQGQYKFSYTQEAQEASSKDDFVPFGSMDDLTSTYVSETLFPIFENRLLTKSRPEYDEYLGWLGLDKSTTKMTELSRSGGVRATDQLQVFPYPEVQDGQYIIQFFAHGLSHLPASSLERLKGLNKGDELLLAKDIQNPANPFALAIRSNDPPEFLGYCPDFLVSDLNILIDQVGADKVQLKVKQLNHDAPLQFKLYCELSCPWVEGFVPFSSLSN